MTDNPSHLLLQRQLLLQLGDRLKRLRKARRLGTVEMAARAGITRNTLRAVETGDPAPSIGTYLRIMTILGVGGDLALLAGDTLQPAPADSAAARSRHAAPGVTVTIHASHGQHQLQDQQSLILHIEAVRLTKDNPALRKRVNETLNRWMATQDARTLPLWREWHDILKSGSWSKVLSRTQRAQQLRQASPLVTILPPETRQAILQEAIDLKKGVEISNMPVHSP